MEGAREGLKKWDPGGRGDNPNSNSNFSRRPRKTSVDFLTITTFTTALITSSLFYSSTPTPSLHVHRSTTSRLPTSWLMSPRLLSNQRIPLLHHHHVIIFFYQTSRPGLL